ncbi:MAG: hypothetical protein C4327_06415 [Meiothermus sp.]
MSSSPGRRWTSGGWRRCTLPSCCACGRRCAFPGGPGWSGGPCEENGAAIWSRPPTSSPRDCWGFCTGGCSIPCTAASSAIWPRPSPARQRVSHRVNGWRLDEHDLVYLFLDAVVRHEALQTPPRPSVKGDNGGVESLKGKLLVSSPSLYDPNFRRTVVLIGEHSQEGAMGVVLNRASDTTVGEAVPDLSALVDADEPVFVGGPVQPQAVIVLAEFDDPEAAATLVVGDIGFARADGDLALLAASTRRARVFAGYAGWSPGQLEAELEEEAWLVEPADGLDLFPEPGSDLFASVLRRKGGVYRILALMPMDPRTN